MTRPNIQVDDEIREMTEEEYSAYIAEEVRVPDALAD